MEQSEPIKYVVATYDEIRLRFGLGGTDQARMKAKRRKWLAEPANHPGAVTRIRVPQEAWDAAPVEAKQGRSPGIDPPVPQEQSRNLKPLQDAIAIFQEERQRLSEVVERHRQERDAALADIGEHRTRAAVLAAKLEAAETALARERDRADRLDADARRPWWRQWMG